MSNNKTNKKRPGTFARFNVDFVQMDCVARLADCMQVSRMEAAGYIALLVAFGIKRADIHGNINDFTPRTIENACLWPSERRGELVCAFQTVGILRGELDSDDFPLTIASELWDAQAAATAMSRENDRNRHRGAGKT